MQSINSIPVNDNFISELSFRDKEYEIRIKAHKSIREDIRKCLPEGAYVKAIDNEYRLYAFIYLMNLLDEYPIENGTFYDCGFKLSNQVLAGYKRHLQQMCLIDYNPNYGLKNEVYYKKGKQKSKSSSKVSWYKVLSNFSSRHSSLKDYIELSYSIDNHKFFEYLKNKALDIQIKLTSLSSSQGLTIEKSKDHTVVPNRYIRINSSSTHYPVTGYAQKSPFDDFSNNLTINELHTAGQGQIGSLTDAFSEANFCSLFCSWYQKLSFKGNEFSISEKKTKAFQETACYFNEEDRRFYHPFHNLRRDYRKAVYFEDEPIVEFFDVHNCHYCLLNALIKNDDSIPQEEKDKFWKLTVEDGKLYESFVEFINNKATRAEVKEQAFTKYLNFRNDTMYRLTRNYNNPSAKKKEVEKFKLLIQLDFYFESVFPNIRKFIYSIKDTDYKALHYKMNEIETGIMLSIVYDLYCKHNIKALTLHDGIYVKTSDAAKMKEMNISTEQMFKEKLINF